MSMCDETTFNPINPATGLPMNDASYGGVDVGGSPYGFDNNSWQNNPCPSTNFDWSSDSF